MSAFESRIDMSVADHYDACDRREEFIDVVTRRMGADDDVLIEGLSDALYDRRTGPTVIRLVRSGDLLAAMQMMKTHAETTYINESAESLADKERL